MPSAHMSQRERGVWVRECRACPVSCLDESVNGLFCLSVCYGIVLCCLYCIFMYYIVILCCKHSGCDDGKAGTVDVFVLLGLWKGGRYCTCCA